MRSALTVTLCAWARTLINCSLPGDKQVPSGTYFSKLEKEGKRVLGLFYLERLLKLVLCQLDEVLLIGGIPQFSWKRGKEYHQCLQHPHKADIILHLVLMRCFTGIDTHTLQPHYGLWPHFPDREAGAQKGDHWPKAKQLVRRGVGDLSPTVPSLGSLYQLLWS